MNDVRLLPYAVADGPHNMAADEVMLATAAEGIASLRFYGWSPATLSLGYFQPAAVRFSDTRWAKLAWLRRPTGGATLVHDHEVTYALALPPGTPWQSGEPWMRRMHRIIGATLESLGVAGCVVAHDARDGAAALCFQQQTPGDLLCHGAKIVGSAQRKHRQCLLQHGAILLAQSESTPELPGILELTGMGLPAEGLAAALAERFAADTGWTATSKEWRDTERLLIERLAVGKYRSAAWNERR